MRVIVLASVLAASSVLAPAGASTPRAVDIFDSVFEPDALAADPGDPVTWTWRGGAHHNVVAHEGAAFDSGTKNSGTFTATYPGGIVRYRCTIHSALDAQGRCSGMCGLIADDTDPPAPPSITEPDDGTVHGSPVSFTGTAPSGAERVRLREGTTTRADVPVGANGGWQANVNFPDGTRTVHAVAVSPIGVESAPSNSITITVDSTPPTVTITEPSDLSLSGNPITAAGTATDAMSAVISVRVDIIDALVGTTTPMTVSCIGCGTPQATWTASGGVMRPGLYRLVATATDAMGHQSAPSQVRVIVLL